MSDRHVTTDDSWVPDSCTLPTAERPLRLAEFDQFFTDAVRGVDRLSTQHLRLQLDGAAQVEETARDLTARESSCCSFFALTSRGPALTRWRWMSGYRRHTSTCSTPSPSGLCLFGIRDERVGTA
jgi:hypothetical protein